MPTRRPGSVGHGSRVTSTRRGELGSRQSVRTRRPEPAEQAATLLHVSNLYYTTPMVELAEALVAKSFADRVFFANSGAEVNDDELARLADFRNPRRRHVQTCDVRTQPCFRENSVHE